MSFITTFYHIIKSLFSSINVAVRIEVITLTKRGIIIKKIEEYRIKQTQSSLLPHVIFEKKKENLIIKNFD